MTLYLIAIGGTGAKCAEAVVHLASAGLYTSEEIKILFVDQDSGNGNVDKAKKAINTYKECRKALSLMTDIDVILQGTQEGVWSPEPNNQPLRDYFQYETMANNNNDIKHLFDVFYTSKEGGNDLKNGFQGVPSIGAGIMGSLQLQEIDPWQSLIKQITTNKTKDKIFLCGSIFGGTGASILPTLSQMLTEKLPNVPICALLMLPYFKFDTKNNPGETEPWADPNNFLLNSALALKYYAQMLKKPNQAQQNDNYLGLKSIYLLGCPQQCQVNDSFLLGGNTQINQPHFIELYAALAVKHFQSNFQPNKVFCIKLNDANQITWGDLPDNQNIKTSLVKAVRFSYAWITFFDKKLNVQETESIRKLAKTHPWFEEFFQSHTMFNNTELSEVNDDKEKTYRKEITDWCKSFLSWLIEIHLNCKDKDENGQDKTLYKIQLFDFQGMNLNNEETWKKVVFSALAYQDKDRINQEPDTIARLRSKLKRNGEPKENKGTIGLVKELYKLCLK